MSKTPRRKDTQNGFRLHNALVIVKNYPIPTLALASLVIGSIFHWVLGFETPAHWIWFATLLIGGIPVVIETVNGMLRKHFASDIVAMLAILAALALNDAFPGVIIVLMQTGGKALENYAYRRASSSLDELLARSPHVAHLRRGEVLEDIDVSRVQIGDVLVVRPGDIVPVDGSISPGYHGQIDESMLTGEPFSRSKNVSDSVYSGTVNVGGLFEMVAGATSGRSQYAKIVELVRKAQQEKAPIQRLADKYAIWFTPITIAMGFVGWVITGDLKTILSVLVVATPCSLIFATPVAIISGINKAAKEGIIIKHGAAIEQIGKVQVALFDKTGTITHGMPKVEKIVCFGDMKEGDLLYRSASVEQFSSHPVAQAIAAKGREQFESLAIPRNFHEIPGAGVEGDLDGEHILVGSKIIIPDTNSLKMTGLVSGDKQDRKMRAFVSINGRTEGAIVFDDSIRVGVASMIQDLKAMGVKKTMILTGDTKENVQSIATETGLTDFRASLLPQDKVSAVKDLRSEFQNVITVGDGINDAPALASATVGVAMGATGTAISAEAADIVLLVDDVTRVSQAIRIGKRTILVAKQSIFVGLGASLALMVIASFGVIPPAVGALLQEALDVTVILNALRAR